MKTHAVKIDDYTLLYECGRGAFGTVYLASDSDNRIVAMKIVSLLGDAGDRELQALESYRKCSNREHMLQIFDVVQKDGPPPYFYYTMEPADNMVGVDSSDYTPCTLSEVLKSQKTLSVSQTTELIGQILEDLAVIHENHLVHRDIKPANIFWVNKRAKLGDIGLLANEHSMTSNAGSPGFMPPANSGIDVNSSAVDLFAITRLIYVCLSGRSVNDYPDMEPTDDLMEHGCHLLSIMNLSTKQLSDMTVQDFQKKLYRSIDSEMTHGISSARTRNTIPSSVAAIVSTRSCTDSQKDEPGSCLSRSTSHTRGHSDTSIREHRTVATSDLSTLSALRDLTSADSWLKKHKIDGSSIAKAVGLGAIGVFGGPVLMGAAAATAYLFKKFTEDKK